MVERGPRPTFQNCIEWRDNLNGEWSSSTIYGEARDLSLDDAMQSEEGLYFQRFKVEAPEGRFAVKTGSAPSDADAAIDSLVPADIQVKVRPARARKKYVDKAERLEKFGSALLHDWRRRRDVLRLIASDMVVRRVGVARVLVDDTLWTTAPDRFYSDGDVSAEHEEEYEDWEVKHRSQNPIILEVRNPRHVRWRQLDSTGELLVVVEDYYTTVLEAYAALGAYPRAKSILRGREPNQPIRVSDVFVGSYRMMALDDQPVFPGKDGVLPHGYPEIPYVIMPFRELHFDEPGLRYRGMLTNAAGLYSIESQVLTMQVWLLAWNAWRTWIGWTQPHRDLSIFPGEYISLNRQRGEYLEMLEGRPVPAELLQTAAVMDAYIQRNGVAQGPRSQEGTRSAQQVWAIQSIRQLKIEPGKQAFQRGVERILGLATMMVEQNLKEPLTLPVPGKDREGRFLGEVRIGAKDVEGYYGNYTVNFGRRLDPALLEQAKALMSLATNNWMPLRTSWEMSGLTDSPQEWEDDLLRQSIDRIDFMLEAAGIMELKEFFGEESDEYKLFLARVAASRRGGGGGGQLGGGSQPTAMRGPTTTPATGEAVAAAARPREASRARGYMGGAQRQPRNVPSAAPPAGG